MRPHWAVKTPVKPCVDLISGEKPCSENTEGRAKQTDGTADFNKKLSYYREHQFREISQKWQLLLTPALDSLYLSVPQGLHRNQLFQPLTHLLLYESNDKYRSAAALFQWAVAIMCTSQAYGFLPYIRGTPQWLQESRIVKEQKGRKTQDLQVSFNSTDLLEETQSSHRNISLRLLLHCFLSSSALPSVLSHPWVWPTPLRTDRSVVFTRPHPPLHPLVTLTWRRAGDCLLRTLAPSWGPGMTCWDFLVSLKQFQNKKEDFELYAGAGINPRARLACVVENCFHLKCDVCFK